MANPAGFASGFTQGFGVVDAAFGRRHARAEQARQFEIRNGLAQASNARAEANQQFANLQRENAMLSSSLQTASTGSLNDKLAVFNSPAALQRLGPGINTENTRIERVQANPETGKLQILVSGTDDNGQGFTLRPVTENGVPVDQGGVPIELTEAELNSRLATGLQGTPFALQVADAQSIDKARPLFGGGPGGEAAPGTTEQPSNGTAQNPNNGTVESVIPPEGELSTSTQPQQQAPTVPAGQEVDGTQLAANGAGTSIGLSRQSFPNLAGAQVPVPNELVSFYETTGERYDLAVDGLALLGGVESGHNADAVNGKFVGVMQMGKLASQDVGLDPDDRADPQKSIDAGGAFLRLKLDEFGGDFRKGLAAYNYGSGRVKGLINQFGDDWFSHLPDGLDSNGKYNAENDVQKYVNHIAPVFEAGSGGGAAPQADVQLAGDPRGAAQQSGGQIQLDPNDPRVGQGLDEDGLPLLPSGQPVTPTGQDAKISVHQVDREGLPPKPSLQEGAPAVAGLLSGQVEVTSSTVGVALGEAFVASNDAPARIADVVNGFFTSVANKALRASAAVDRGQKAAGRGIVEFLDAATAGDEEKRQIVASAAKEAMPTFVKDSTAPIKGESFPAGSEVATTVAENLENTPTSAPASPTKLKTAAVVFERALSNPGRSNTTAAAQQIPYLLQRGIINSTQVQEWMATGAIRDPLTIEMLKAFGKGDSYAYVENGQVKTIIPPAQFSAKDIREGEKFLNNINDRQRELLSKQILNMVGGDKERAAFLEQGVINEIVNDPNLSLDLLGAMSDDDIRALPSLYQQMSTMERHARSGDVTQKIGRWFNIDKGSFYGLFDDNIPEDTDFTLTGNWQKHIPGRGILIDQIEGLEGGATTIAGGTADLARGISDDEAMEAAQNIPALAGISNLDEVKEKLVELLRKENQTATQIR